MNRAADPSGADAEPNSGDYASAADRANAVEIVLSVGAIMLGAGSPTDAVERAMRSAAAALRLARSTAVVSFGTIALSYAPIHGAEPITAVRLTTERTTDFRRLTAAAALVRDLRASRTDIREAAAEIRRIQNLRAWPKPLTGFGQAAAAGATGLLFGGSAIDGLATLLVSATVVIVGAWLDRSGLPPFFRSLFGPLASTLLVAAAVALNPQINPVPVLAGSLLPFLPGGALVAGMRDLIDQSIVSGTARLTEAVFLGAAVAAGTAIGIGLASQVDVALEIGIVDNPHAWSLPTQVVVAGIACGAWSIPLGGTRRALLAASALGALGWLAFLMVAALGFGIVAATAFAGVALGSGARMLARGGDAPTVHWVVPASLPLLPGLPIVYGMLAADAVDGLVQLATAVATALALGSAIAFGEILVQTIRRVGVQLLDLFPTRGFPRARSRDQLAVQQLQVAQLGAPGSTNAAEAAISQERALPP